MDDWNKGLKEYYMKQKQNDRHISYGSAMKEYSLIYRKENNLPPPRKSSKKRAKEQESAAATATATTDVSNIEKPKEISNALPSEGGATEPAKETKKTTRRGRKTKATKTLAKSKAKKEEVPAEPEGDDAPSNE